MRKPGLLTSSPAIKQSFLPVCPQLQRVLFSALFSSSRGGVKVGYAVEDVNVCSVLDAPSCSGPPQSSSPSLKWEQLFSWAWSLRAQWDHAHKAWKAGKVHSTALWDLLLIDSRMSGYKGWACARWPRSLRCHSTSGKSPQFWARQDGESPQGWTQRLHVTAASKHVVELLHGEWSSWAWAGRGW